MTKKRKTKKPVVNSLTGFTQGLMGQSPFTPTINQTTTAFLNNRFNLIFNNRSLLNELYIEHGLIQTLVDMPVDDGLRGGVEIKSDQMSEDDIAELQHYIERERIMEKIGQTIKWGRLFGGGGLVIITNQDPKEELKLNKVSEFSTLDFYPADLWELNLNWYSENPLKKLEDDTPYMLYGSRLHKSRVLEFKGKVAPSLYRRKMRGWGMTEVERVLRSFNQYIKNNNVIFELLDEAKVDVFKIQNFNTALMTQQGTTGVQNRVQMANQVKNYLNSLVMDTDDEYEQKQISFSGLGEMLTQIRMGIAADLKMPLTKLFGVSSAGFNSGEDDIENYNAMIEHEVRAKAKHIIIKTLEICSAKLFGFVPDDMAIEFEPLRILSAEQEENVKNAQANRAVQFFQAGLVSAEETKEAINKDDLLAVTVEVNDEIFDVPNQTDAAIPDEDDINVKKPRSSRLRPEEVKDV